MVRAFTGSPVPSSSGVSPYGKETWQEWLRRQNNPVKPPPPKPKRKPSMEPAE